MIGAFQKYVYGDNSSVSNIYNDVKAIALGETNKANLSTDCVQANTNLTTANTSWWQDFDGQFRSPYADDPSHYKYFQIEFTTNGLIYIRIFEDRDDIGHVNINETPASPISQSWNTGVGGGTIYIGVSERYFVLASEHGTTWGDGNYKGIVGVFELSRDQPWNTVAAAYPNFCVIQTSEAFREQEGAYIPRAKNTSNNDITMENTKAYISSDSVGTTEIDQSTRFPNTLVYDDTGQQVVPFLPINILNALKYGPKLGSISGICDVWMGPNNTLANLEAVPHSNQTDEYIAIQVYYQNYHWLLPNS